MNTIQLITAIIIGAITAVVSYRALRDFSMFNAASLPIALCVGALAAVGIARLGEGLFMLIALFAALGIAVAVISLVVFIIRHLKMGTGYKAGKSSGVYPRSAKSANVRNSVLDKYQIGSLLPPEKGD